MAVQYAACAQDVHLSHSIQHRTEAYRVLRGLSDELDLAVLVACHASGLGKATCGSQESPAHARAEISCFLKDIVPECLAVPVADTGGHRLLCDRIASDGHNDCRRRHKTGDPLQGSNEPINLQVMPHGTQTITVTILLILLQSLVSCCR
jgi:hypothetical protein